MRRPRPTRGLSRQGKKTHTRLYNLLYSKYVMDFNQLVCHILVFGAIDEYVLLLSLKQFIVSFHGTYC